MAFTLDMNAAERTPYLEAGDVLLLPLGFKRKKREFEWRRFVGNDIEFIHINFGLDVINPSYGVSYKDLVAPFPSELGVKCGPWYMLQALTGKNYSSSTTPPTVVSHDMLMAIGEFPRLRDREAFTKILMGDILPYDLVCLSSVRMRMLPVLLASLGRIEEAIEWLARFECEALSKDQMLPRYEVFAAHFRSIYETKNI